MRTNFLSNTCRFIVNKSDYLPFVSTVTNLVYIFQKAVILPIKQKESMPKSSYYSHLSLKSFSRCIILLLPVLGNIIVGIYDFAHRKNYNKNAGIEPIKHDDGTSAPANLPLDNDIKIDPTTEEQNGSDLEYTNEAPMNSNNMFEEVYYRVFYAKVRKDGLILKYAAPKLCNNKELVLAAVQQNGLAFKYASQELQNDREVVLTAVQQNGLALKYASQELQNDREVVLTAVQQDASAVQYASQELQNDPIIIALATSE
ncbi:MULTISPECIES: DUF4116 domain-containing protein [unclassified Neochlamydia]|uniref:DUF4116 domain-containing protein n=1 Tax=unclassified Neochlamydia TaxID=2643326 RepID=UPI001408795D|nr:MULTISPECIES: DUF4116 domain-containing protein [unclassified Neochlamydia]MBS4165958.1 Uncharacterized protein [Neochlamydia sp. AcF65]NGY95931.1 hypothetical protein [Neochlamydia sp. AcF84]